MIVGFAFIIPTKMSLYFFYHDFIFDGFYIYYGFSYISSLIGEGLILVVVTKIDF